MIIIYVKGIILRGKSSIAIKVWALALHHGAFKEREKGKTEFLTIVVAVDEVIFRMNQQLNEELKETEGLPV